MRIAVLSVVLAAILVSGARAEQGRPFVLSAPLADARWEPRALAGGCTLSHDVPGYGQVRFVGDPDGRLHFELDPWWRPRTAIRIAVASAPPSWRHKGETRELGIIRLEPESGVVSASGDMARGLLLELKQGRELQFRHPGWVAGQGAVDVRLVPVRFERAALSFRNCVGELPRDRPPPIDAPPRAQGVILP